MTESQSAAPSAAPTESQALLAKYLRDRDVPCPRCGYNLRMLPGDRCSECGLRVALGLHAAEPMLGAWVTASVASSLCSGIGLMFTALSIGMRSLPPQWYRLTMWLSLASMPITMALIWKRRWMLRRSATVQRVIAYTLIGLLILLVVRMGMIR